MENLIEAQAQVIYDKETQSMNVALNGFLPYENMMKIFQYEYEMIRYYNIKRCLIDLRKIQVYAIGVKEHIKDTWFPQIAKDGVQQVAFIVPENLFAERSMNGAHKEAKNESALNIQYFKDEETALYWLTKECQTSA